MKTVKEFSRLSGVSVRTLHYYDHIGLLKPTFVAENGYRYYDQSAFQRLQEILLFRELEFPLKDIKKILSEVGYDKEEALSQQIKLLELKKLHLEKLICHAKGLQEKGENMMDFTAYDKTELEAFEREARERWGETKAYQEFSRQTSSEDFEILSTDMSAMMAKFGQLKDLPVDNKKVQEQVKVLQDYISQHFYTCTPEVLASLGEMYATDNRFTETIDKAGGQGTAHFISSAINYYCQ